MMMSYEMTMYAMAKKTILYGLSMNKNAAKASSDTAILSKNIFEKPSSSSSSLSSSPRVTKTSGSKSLMYLVISLKAASLSAPSLISILRVVFIKSRLALSTDA